MRNSELTMKWECGVRKNAEPKANSADLAPHYLRIPHSAFRHSVVSSEFRTPHSEFRNVAWRPQKSQRQTATLATAATKSPTSAAGTAWRVRRTPTAPKYTAST